MLNRIWNLVTHGRLVIILLLLLRVGVRIRFGDGYGLSVDSVLGEYTAITARIRAQTGLIRAA